MSVRTAHLLMCSEPPADPAGRPACLFEHCITCLHPGEQGSNVRLAAAQLCAIDVRSRQAPAHEAGGVGCNTLQLQLQQAAWHQPRHLHRRSGCVLQNSF